uniref:Uncharacterized protein n=1 Tax=Opuntia streptacantha TaxID=393608 RepID=A0A7C8ZN90_OPUST
MSCFLCRNSQALHRALLLGLTQNRPSRSQPLTRSVNSLGSASSYGLCFFTWSHSAFSLSASHLPSHRALLLQSGSASSRSHSTYSLSTSLSLSHQALLLGLT